MARLIFLGTAAAVADESHETSHLLLVGERHSLMVDCAASSLQRLQRLGVAFDSLTDIILTHFHADHVSGLPNLLTHLWLSGRKQPLTLHGPADTLERTRQMLELFSWQNWAGLYPVHFHSLAESQSALVLESADFRISASPVQHLIPTLGLRIQSQASGAILAYSCDTEPCPEVVGLAQGAAALVHEATGPYRGHSTAAQAGEIAAQAGAGSLYLIHYPSQLISSAELLRQARSAYNGPVSLAEDFGEVRF